MAAWLGAATAASAGSLDEVRFGVLDHNIEPSNAEDGADLNFEVLFRRSTYSYNNGFLDLALRPRIHLGTSINTAGETSQLYAGLTWGAKVAPKWSMEVSFGGSAHNGPTGGGYADSYGCPVNFRESFSVGYDLDDRWTLYGTVAHMSNANLCDHNTGITSIGLRLGYKFNTLDAQP